MQQEIKHAHRKISLVSGWLLKHIWFMWNVPRGVLTGSRWRWWWPSCLTDLRDHGCQFLSAECVATQLPGGAPQNEGWLKNLWLLDYKIYITIMNRPAVVLKFYVYLVTQFREILYFYQMYKKLGPLPGIGEAFKGFWSSCSLLPGFPF